MLSRNGFSTFESLEHRTLFAAVTDIDNSFSGDGKVITDFGGANDVAHAVAVQSDGRIVVAGETLVTVNGVKKTAFAAVRYNKDGSLDDGGSKDTTKGDKFGTGGKLTRVLGDGGGTGALAVAIQKDGKIILGGNAIKSTASGSQWYFLRLNKDGTLDSGFGSAGIHATNFPATNKAQFKAMALSPGGQLVTTGTVDGNWQLRRLTTSGQLDNGFGNGTLPINFGGIDVPTAITFDPSGRIIVAGNVAGDGTFQDVGIVRYQSNGVPDNSFGLAGAKRFVTGFNKATDVGGVVARPNGEIIVSLAGRYTNLNGDTLFTAGRYRFDGNGDFIGAGTAGPRTSANGVLNTADDTVIYGGTALNGGPPESFYLETPQRFVGFGNSSDHSVATALALAPDGKIVQVGYTTAGGGGKNFAIVRYIGSPVSQLGTISGNVFFDVDRDGFRDVNYDGAGVAMRVFIDNNNDGIWDSNNERSVLSDFFGNYKFAVPAGTHRIRLLSLPTNKQTFPLSQNQSHVVTIAAKQKVGEIDFGFASTSPGTTPNSISGSVFFDFDGDGFRDLQNPAEPDLAGRTVFLDLNGNDKLDAGDLQSKTDLGGNFFFGNLQAGNYRIGDVLPNGWTHTEPPSGFIDVALQGGASIVCRFATTFADPDDTITEADHAAGNQSGVGKSVNFSIANVTDVDMIRFTAKKNQKIGFDLDRASGSSLNSYLRIFNANGTQLAFNDDAAAPGESKGSDSYLSFTFNAAGNYYIGVSNNQNKKYEPNEGYDDNGVGSTGGYKLSLVNISTTALLASKAVTPSLFADQATQRDEILAS